MASLTYQDWADLLGSHLLQPGNARRPIFIYVDDATIAEIIGSDDRVSAVDDLVTAVRGQFGDISRGETFTPLTTDSIRWFESGQTTAPFCVPLLATFVIAATRMVAEDGIASHNYYARLHTLLRLPGHGRPAGFDYASKALWPRMSSWLDGTMRGEVGLSTIPPAPTLPYVGFPLSQALWRTSDRNRFYEFLAEGLHPDPAAIPVDQLVGEFEFWANREGGLSPGARLLVNRPQLRAELTDIISSLVPTWDGTVPGRVRSVGLRVMSRFDHLGRPKVGLVVGPAPLDASSQLTDPAGRIVECARMGRWLLPGDLDTMAVLDEGITLRSDEIRARHEPNDLHILTTDTDLGGWVETTAAPAGMEVRLLVRLGVVELVERYLEGWATPGYSRRQVDDSPWHLIRGVVLRPDRPRPLDPRVSSLAAPPGDVTQLSGGLTRSPGQYLVGAEPDVVMRSGFGSLRLPVLLGGILVGEVGEDRPVALSGLCALGRQQLVVGPTELSFTVLESDPRSLPTRSLATTLGPLTVTSATLLPADSARPMTLRRGYRHTVIGSRPCEIVDVPAWSKPKWMLQLDHEATDFEFWPSFAVVFLISRRRAARTVKVAQSIAPSQEHASGDCRAWAKALLEMPTEDLGPKTRDLVAEYQRVAQGILDG